MAVRYNVQYLFLLLLMVKYTLQFNLYHWKILMTDKQNNNHRRRLLKNMLTGTGIVSSIHAIPEIWVKPVVDSVVLPAHAQTSIAVPPPAPIVFTANVAVPGAPGSGLGDGLFNIEAIPMGADQYMFNILNPDNDALRSGVLNIDGTPGVLVSNPACAPPFGRSFNTFIVSASPTEIVLRIDRNSGGNIDFTLTPGAPLNLTVADCT